MWYTVEYRSYTTFDVEAESWEDALDKAGLGNTSMRVSPDINVYIDDVCMVYSENGEEVEEFV